VIDNEFAIFMEGNNLLRSDPATPPRRQGRWQLALSFAIGLMPDPLLNAWCLLDSHTTAL
jgi:hypothetical protein